MKVGTYEMVYKFIDYQECLLFCNEVRKAKGLKLLEVPSQTDKKIVISENISLIDTTFNYPKNESELINSKMLEQGFTSNQNDVINHEELLELSFYLVDVRQEFSSFQIDKNMLKMPFWPLPYNTETGIGVIIDPNKEQCVDLVRGLVACRAGDKSVSTNECLNNLVSRKLSTIKCNKKNMFVAGGFLGLKDDFESLMGDTGKYGLANLASGLGKVKMPVIDKKIVISDNTKTDNAKIIDTTFNYPNNESELLKKYYSFEDKWTGIEYLKYVIKNTKATDTNSILIFAYAHLFKIIDQSVYFYKSTLISQEEWNSNYEMLSMFPANLIQKGEGKRAFYLFAFIVCGQKTNNNTIQYWQTILEEFNSENCPLGAEFYAQCKKVTDEYSNNLKLAEEKQAKVNSDNLLKSQLFNYFSQGVTNGIKEAKQNLDEVLNGDGCYQCFTSGNCKKCTKGQYQVFFKNNQQCSEYNSTAYKVGYIICTKCRGSEYILSSCNGCGNDKCRGELCDNKLCTEGWTKCLDCNSNNSNSQIGKCSSCKGTGKTH